MSINLVKCPNCGSISVTSVGSDKYNCSHCKAYFQLVRPDLQRTDVVGHNCPSCGKPIEAGKGYKCVKCDKYDLCETCVDDVPNRGYMCKSCIKEIGENCVICSRFAWRVCGSCKNRFEKGEIPNDEVMKTCNDCFDSLFTTQVDLKTESNINIPGGLKVSFNCPKCGEVCFDCAVEKKGLLSSGYYCKNCGSKINLNKLWAADGSI